MMRLRSALLGLVLASASASAQPVTRPADVPALATIRDDKQLAEALAEITNDPSIRVDDPKARALAQALMTEGVKQLQAQAYDQALANFLEAYAQFPSPKILLDVASTLRDMGRLADASNTYQRYLGDPATGADRVAEVKELMLKLDGQLTILTVRVFPRGSEVSIDGGPFVAVGSSLLTRVRPGIHMVRVKHGDASSEVTVNGFEGEQKELPIVLQNAVDTASPTATATATSTSTSTTTTTTTTTTAPKTNLGDKLPIDTTAPEQVEGWLITGTKYSADSGTGRARKVHAGNAGAEVAAIVPKYETSDTGEVVVQYTGEDHISSGVLGVMRIDGHGRGIAGGVGLAYTPVDRVELEAAVLISEFWGGYIGARYRLLTGKLRPYVDGGLPLFFFDDGSSTRIAPGIRAAAGLELEINGHLSVTGDLGVEHFWNVDGAIYKGMYTIDADVFVPTLGVVGRL
ncbi:MAG: hypothetical protein ACM31C_34995 [Acidobacteriota bacterium]